MLCCLVICNSVSASKSKISSKDLTAVMDRYLDQLVKNDPTGLPVAKTVKVTENGYTIQLGNGLFQTAEKIT